MGAYGCFGCVLCLYVCGDCMNDKELLELAAKAAGYIETASIQDGYGFIALRVMDEDGDWTGKDWNPLTDDGDALRLAVKLNMGISIHDQHCMACAQLGVMQTVKDMPTDEATRRAIVRAAAEIGKNAA